MKFTVDTIKQYGQTIQVTCPKCEKTGQMLVLKADNGLGIDRFSTMTMMCLPSANAAERSTKSQASRLTISSLPDGRR